MFSIRIIYLYTKQIRNVILYIKKKVLKGFEILKNYKKLIYIKMIYNWSVKFEIRELNSGILKLVLRFWKIYINNTI
jgi:hypothetical protein